MTATRAGLVEACGRIGRNHGLLLTVDYMTGSGYRIDAGESQFVSPRLDVRAMRRWMQGFEDGLDMAKRHLGAKPSLDGQALQGVKNGPPGDRLYTPGFDENGEIHCDCGNRPTEEGFDYCDPNGKPVDPVPESWLGWYRCSRCGKLWQDPNVTPTFEPRCLAEMAQSQADVVELASVQLVGLMLHAQEVHGGVLGDLLEKVSAIQGLMDAVTDYYLETDPEQRCRRCAEVPGQ